jgi:hypothetical protein
VKCKVGHLFIHFYRTIDVTWWCKGGACPLSPTFFLSKNNFLSIELKRGQIKVEVFFERLLGRCTDKKKRNFSSYGRQKIGILIPMVDFALSQCYEPSYPNVLHSCVSKHI